MERPDFKKHGQELDNRIRVATKNRDRFRARGARYTTILHNARQKLELSMTEYALADSIHRLSGSHSSVPGWCYASKETLSVALGIPERTIFRMIDTLAEKGLVEVNSHTHYLRTTELWYSTVEVFREEAFGNR